MTYPITWLLVVITGALFLIGVAQGAERQMTSGNKDLPVVHVQPPSEEEWEQLRQRDERDRPKYQNSITPVR